MQQRTKGQQSEEFRSVYKIEQMLQIIVNHKLFCYLIMKGWCNSFCNSTLEVQQEAYLSSYNNLGKEVSHNVLEFVHGWWWVI